MIDRSALLKRNRPVLHQWDAESPLSVGNGEFAFTTDVTGLQTFYQEQKAAFVPLCTMSQWGWHSSPAGEHRNLWYQPQDIQKTAYKSARGTVFYASEMQPGNEEIYHWLRINPHRFNLARVGFLWDGKEIHPSQVRECTQILELEQGILKSKFVIEGYSVEVETVCAGSNDILGISIHSDALKEKRLSVLLAFPYGSKDITASDWEHPFWHETKIASFHDHETHLTMVFLRILDKDTYQVELNCENKAKVTERKAHHWDLFSEENRLVFTLSFYQKEKIEEMSYEAVKDDSREKWKNFWNTCGMIDFEGSKDDRAPELERRIVLSQYLLALQSLGSVPPQETGLTCNSWYGKMHLEMYPWHCAWTALWNKGERLENSFRWYQEHLPQARENAACNGYRGARWPKMVDSDAMDSPSRIAVLLIWQQPHIIWMLYLKWKASKDDNLIEKYWDVIEETAEFMCDFAYFNEEKKCYELSYPLIPAQENHDARTTKNPVFELEYWRFTLEIAADWAEKLKKDGRNWREVSENMALPAEKDGLYLACETCPATFTKFNKDHPSMTAAFGLLPGKHIVPEKMKATLKKILECWDFDTTWGWDFAMLAMTAVRLGEPKLAIEILLKDTSKNQYVASGNNFQKLRTDLPLYLPGNGSLLLAAAMMTAGYKGCTEELPGFPKDGNWKVQYENVIAFPY